MKNFFLVVALCASAVAQTPTSSWKQIESKATGVRLYVHQKPQRNGGVVTGWQKLVQPNGDMVLMLSQCDCRSKRFRLLAEVVVSNGDAFPGNSVFLPNGTTTTPWTSIGEDSPGEQIFVEQCRVK